MTFQPVNLLTAPARWPTRYLELEREFTADIIKQFDEAREGTIIKDSLRRDVADKKKEFNRLWNMRSNG